MTEPRPHREAAATRAGGAARSPRRRAPGASTPTRSRRWSRRPASAPPRLERPAGLTEREAEVVAMLARGLQTKQVARHARDLGQDGRPPRPERLPQDRRLDPGRSDPVRDGARARRMGRTPDCATARSALSVVALDDPPSATRSEGGRHGHRHPRRYRREILEIAEAIAPTWERRRAEIEEVATPVREWMLRELRPQEGDTVLELAAGIGRDWASKRRRSSVRAGRLITTDFSPAMLDAARRRGAELGADERRLPGHRRRADRARRRLGRRCALPLRVHADGRPRGRVRGDAPGAAPRRPAGAGGLGRAGAQPVLRDPRRSASSSAGTSRRLSRHRRPGRSAWPSVERVEGAAARRRLRRGSHRGGAGTVRCPRRRTST